MAYTIIPCITNLTNSILPSINRHLPFQAINWAYIFSKIDLKYYFLSMLQKIRAPRQVKGVLPSWKSKLSSNFCFLLGRICLPKNVLYLLLLTNWPDISPFLSNNNFNVFKPFNSALQKNQVICIEDMRQSSDPPWGWENT